MPSLGGVTVWLSVGEQKLAEYDVRTHDDRAEAVIVIPDSSSGPLPYAVNWRIADSTYSYAVKLTVDGTIKVEKLHLGQRSLGKQVGHINGLPLTDDWSKRRLFRFVRLTADADSTPPGPEVGSISIAFHRAARTGIVSGFKSTATGFHKPPESTPTVESLVTQVPEESLKDVSHATGLGEISFGAAKRVPGTENEDQEPFVSFVLKYRSKDVLPAEWFPVAQSAAAPSATSDGAVSDITSEPVVIGNEPASPGVPATAPPAAGGTIQRQPTFSERAKRLYDDAVLGARQSYARRGPSTAGAEPTGVHPPTEASPTPIAEAHTHLLPNSASATLAGFDVTDPVPPASLPVDGNGNAASSEPGTAAVSAAYPVPEPSVISADVGRKPSLAVRMKTAVKNATANARQGRKERSKSVDHSSGDRPPALPQVGANGELDRLPEVLPATEEITTSVAGASEPDRTPAPPIASTSASAQEPSTSTVLDANNVGEIPEENEAASPGKEALEPVTSA